MNNRIKAGFCLIKDMNCALATMEAMQDITGLRDDTLLRAVTGLEGGVVASGSTCGVVTAGALSIALMNDESLKEDDPKSEAALLYLVGEYVHWFRANFGATNCRERSDVDFYTASGQLRYLLPGDRVARCINHIGRAADFLYNRGGTGLTSSGDNEEYLTSTGDEMPVHCARQVLRGVKLKTGVGSPLVERLSLVFDGGLGLTGGICGALAGAIMAVNLVFGMDVRTRSYPGIMKDFVIGHSNLLKQVPSGMPEPFGIGKDIVSGFNKGVGRDSTACKEITGREFSDYPEFQGYIAKSDVCRDIMDLSIGLASHAIEEWR